MARGLTERKLRALTRLPVEEQIAAAVESVPGFTSPCALGSKPLSG